MQISKNPFLPNNFDLLRLFAASQVAFLHSTTHLGIDAKNWFFTQFLELFPGVPLFFFVSGFLISKSFESNQNLSGFAINRALRIFPALVVCTVVSVAAVGMTGYLSQHWPGVPRFSAWIVGQVSFFQFYNPEFMRGFGVGVLNGSLWTISVELQFYCLVPLLYWATRRGSEKYSMVALVCLIGFFLVLNRVYAHLDAVAPEDFWVKLFGVSFAPWYYMFLVGVLFQRNFLRLHALVANKLIFIIVFYLVLAMSTNQFFGWALGNKISPLTYLALAVLAFSLVYARPTTGDQVLHRNDVSYGLYIYHMPVVNVLLFLGLGNQITALGMALVCSLALATISWFYVEKPSLRKKKRALLLL